MNVNKIHTRHIKVYPLIHILHNNHLNPFKVVLLTIIMSKQIIISPSSIALFIECPRCFWLYKTKGIRRPSMAFPSLPSGMDKILKEHFDEHRKDGSRPNEINSEIGGKLSNSVVEDLMMLNTHIKYSRCEDGMTIIH